MKVFCPNCGSDNEGMPGGRVTCKACTASFEVPRGETGGPAPAPNPPPTSQPWPGVGSTPNPPPPSSGGWVGADQGSEPISTFSNPSPSMPVVNNTLAIVSLVLGILCCIPFGGIGAIVTGVIARNQIATSGGQQKGSELAMVGIILGALSMALAVIGFVLGLIGQH